MTTMSALDTCREQVALRPGVYRVSLRDGRARLVAGTQAVSIGRPSQAQEAVLRRLASGSGELAELHAIGAASGDPRGVVELIGRLRSAGWLATTVFDHDRPLYTLVPMRAAPPKRGVVADTELSRFAIIRRETEHITVESPRAWCDVRIHDAAVLAVATGLGQPGHAVSVRQRMINDLCWAGVLVPKGTEDDQPQLRQWRPHELWFHERSRWSQRSCLGGGFGGTYWGRGVFDPLPAEPEPYPGRPVVLPRPDLDRLRRDDSTLTAVLENRRTVRGEHCKPPTIGQLGEFLYRCARTRRLWEVDGVERASRPYPSGGSMAELELYPVVNVADGIAPGMYHYDSHRHVLRPVAEITTPAVRRLCSVAGRSAEMGPPQVLIIVSARFGRLMWKYEAISYSLTLKHVGVLYQTMYCVATAMGLAPCALGCGDTVAFAEATGRDPMVESSVGEFILGGSAAAHTGRMS